MKTKRVALVAYPAVAYLAAVGAAQVVAQTYTTAEPPSHSAPPALAPGLYKIKSSLELPHIEETGVYVERTLCLVREGGTGNHGFEVMSQNNPLAHCPMINVHETGDILTFDIKCTGSNLAKASASYLLLGDMFRGRINMTMGGKNMTMTEVQEGHRTGACGPPS